MAKPKLLLRMIFARGLARHRADEFDDGGIGSVHDGIGTGGCLIIRGPANAPQANRAPLRAPACLTVMNRTKYPRSLRNSRSGPLPGFALHPR